MLNYISFLKRSFFLDWGSYYYYYIWVFGFGRLYISKILFPKSPWCSPTTPFPPTTPTLTPFQYVCAPDGNQTGSCEPFAVPTLSLSPKIYSNNPPCQGDGADHKNRYKDSKGKYRPDLKLSLNILIVKQIEVSFL